MSLDWAAIARTDLPVTGPIAFDADLSADNILAAAAEGFYCFPAPSTEAALINEIRYAADVDSGDIQVNADAHEPYSVAWLCPDPRPVTDLSARRTGRTMRRLARRRAQWRTTINAAFDEVLDACASARESTWITGAMREAMHELHQMGSAHSSEVWHDDRLVGGVVGLQLGAVFSADSQFTAVEGAGKIAVVDLMTRFMEGGGKLFDFQFESTHAQNLGAAPMSRTAYLGALHRLHRVEVDIPQDRRSAEHIAELVST